MRHGDLVDLLSTRNIGYSRFEMNVRTFAIFSKKVKNISHHDPNPAGAYYTRSADTPFQMSGGCRLERGGRLNPTAQDGHLLRRDGGYPIPEQLSADDTVVGTTK